MVKHTHILSENFKNLTEVAFKEKVNYYAESFVKKPLIRVLRGLKLYK